MEFTEFKFDPAELVDAVAAIKTEYAESGRKQDWQDYVAGFIWTRLRAAPARYVEYGPYWWAVKAALVAKGLQFGSDTDAIVLPQYSFQTEEGTIDIDRCLVAGEKFKEYYGETYLSGTRDFALTDDGNLWTLFDSDLELLATAI